MSGPYDDILDLPHHVSATRPQMSLENRAAQFSPFAALTGYDAAVRETARLTDARIELAGDGIDALNAKLRALAKKTDERPEITVTYFCPDDKKEGGAYVTATGALKKIDEAWGVVVLATGEEIAVADILDIESV